jgi:hypothetical protein
MAASLGSVTLLRFAIRLPKCYLAQAHQATPTHMSMPFQAYSTGGKIRKGLCIVFSALWLSLPAPALFAQIDTARKEFFPLHIGDLWQYRDEYGGLVIQQVIGDTLLDGHQYSLLIHSLRTSGGGITRVDSLLRVINRRGLPTAGDSCGGASRHEESIYRLGESDSSVWPICEIFFGMPSSSDLVRFNGIGSMNVFGERREVMEFDFGGTSGDTASRDTLFGFGALLARGIGVLYEQYYESGYYMLQGAIIDGVKFGTIVTVGEIPGTFPAALSLQQNFPNPFNPTTSIRYEVPTATHISLKVFDLLGRQIAVLVDELKAPGSHQVVFDGEGVASGVYFYRLVGGPKSLTGKMILQR